LSLCKLCLHLKKLPRVTGEIYIAESLENAVRLRSVHSAQSADADNTRWRNGTAVRLLFLTTMRDYYRSRPMQPALSLRYTTLPRRIEISDNRFAIAKQSTSRGCQVGWYEKHLIHREGHPNASRNLPSAEVQRVFRFLFCQA